MKAKAKMKSTTTVEREFIRLAEVLRLIPISESTLRRYVRDGLIEPPRRLGVGPAGIIAFRRKSILAFIENSPLAWVEPANDNHVEHPRDVGAAPANDNHIAEGPRRWRRKRKTSSSRRRRGGQSR